MVSGWLRTHNLWKSESCKKHTNVWPQSLLAFWFKCLWFTPTPVTQVCQFSSVLDSWPFSPILTGYRTFQPPNIQPLAWNHEILNTRVEGHFTTGLFNLRLFNHFRLKSGVKAWSWIVRGWNVLAPSHSTFTCMENKQAFKSGFLKVMTNMFVPVSRINRKINLLKYVYCLSIFTVYNL